MQVKRLKITILDIFVSIAFSFLIADFARRFFDFPRNLWVILAVFLSALFIFIFTKGQKSPVRKSYYFPYLLVPLLVAYFCFWYEKMFGVFDPGALLFHMEMGVENITDDNSLTKAAIRYFSFFALLSISLFYLINNFKIIRILDRIAAVPIILSTPIVAYLVGVVYYSEYNSVMAPLFREISTDIKLNNPPKNIIMIYAESGERTYQYLQGGQDIYAPMISIASKGLEAINIEQVANTGWTVAGLVASQCGTSLQPVGLMRFNNFTKRQDFLPSAVCLSDILTAHGYVNEFLNGADLAFAGMSNFLYQHNYQWFNGFHAYSDQVGDYINTWGLFDDTLLEAAIGKVQALKQQGKPFLFTVMTIGGHRPDGHITQECEANLAPASSKEILFAVQCMGHHIKEFIKTLESDDLLENTVLVVMSDHLVMATEISAQLDKHERRNFFTIIGDGIEVGINDKPMATFDIFPTILEVLGFEIPDHRAGLGVSMFSAKPSLVEQYGNKQLSKMLEFDRSLAKKIWFTKSDL